MYGLIQYMLYIFYQCFSFKASDHSRSLLLTQITHLGSDLLFDNRSHPYKVLPVQMTSKRVSGQSYACIYVGNYCIVD